MPYPPTQLHHLGKHKANDVYYYSPDRLELDSLPRKNWICVGIANKQFDSKFFDEFIIFSVGNGLLEFKGQGKHGEFLHDIFDEVIAAYEVYEEVETDIMTIWRNDGPNDLAEIFWGCFYANVLPEGVNQDEVSVVCIGFDGEDYSNNLKELLNKINLGWIPPDDE